MSLKADAVAIFRAGVKAADPYDAVLHALTRARLGKPRAVWVIGAGKASAQMARAVEERLGRDVAGGLINTKDGHTAKLRRIVLQEASHPVPDARGVDGARRIAAIASAAREGDLVLCLISGGASALMPLPADPITLEEKQATTRLLLECGANIHELNCVRKHISAIKGGQLARLAAPARVVSLILSDVIGDDLDVIGSGPTVADSSTAEQARKILDRFGVWTRVPESVRTRISSGAETPKPGDRALANVTNLIVGSNRIAAEAAAAHARSLGYRTMILSTTIDGETRDVARVHASIAREIHASGVPLKPPACVITGGETTVTLRGQGKGGRNQEFALSAALGIAGLPGVAILSAGTDGTDGPTDAAGAYADGRTIARASKKGLDAAVYLRDNNSYEFFAPLRDLITTGPTGTNVMDLQVILVE